MGDKYVLHTRLEALTGHRLSDLDAVKRVSLVALPTMRVRAGRKGPGMGAMVYATEPLIRWLASHLGNWNTDMESRIRAEAAPLDAIQAGIALA